MRSSWIWTCLASTNVRRSLHQLNFTEIVVTLVWRARSLGSWRSARANWFLPWSEGQACPVHLTHCSNIIYWSSCFFLFWFLAFLSGSSHGLAFFIFIIIVGIEKIINIRLWGIWLLLGKRVLLRWWELVRSRLHEWRWWLLCSRWLSLRLRSFIHLKIRRRFIIYWSPRFHQRRLCTTSWSGPSGKARGPSERPIAKYTETV